MANGQRMEQGEREGDSRGDERDCEGMKREVIRCVEREEKKRMREKRVRRVKGVSENGDGE